MRSEELWSAFGGQNYRCGGRDYSKPRACFAGCLLYALCGECATPSCVLTEVVRDRQAAGLKPRPTVEERGDAVRDGQTGSQCSPLRVVVYITLVRLYLRCARPTGGGTKAPPYGVEERGNYVKKSDN